MTRLSAREEFEAELDLVLPRKGEKYALIGCLPRTTSDPIIVGFETESQAAMFLSRSRRSGYRVTEFSDITQEARERRGIIRRENYR